MSFEIGKNLAILPSFRSQIDRDNIKVLTPETVAVPLLQGDFDAKATVEIGDSVKVGQLIGLKNKPDFYFPIFAPVSGEVVAIVKKMSARLKPCEYIVIKNDFKMESIPLMKSVSLDSSREDILDFIKVSGIQEFGALAYQRYDTQCETVVINLVEDDPYLMSDVVFAEDYIEEFNLGIALVKKVTGAKKVIVASHSDCSFKGKLEDAENCVLKAVYPLADHQLLKNALGLKEALVVEGTAITRLGLAAVNRSSSTYQYVTVAGDSIGSPSIISCPSGTSCGDLLNACDCEDGVHNLMIGGPMTGTAVTTMEVAISQVVNEVTVFPHTDVPAQPCIRCGQCSFHCPMGLIPTEIVSALKTSDVDTMAKLDVLSCMECGLCSYVCPSGVPITESIRRAKKYYSLRRKK